MKVVNTEEFYALIGEDKPVVCDFFANWCGPCRMLSPILEKIAEETGDKAVFVKLDTDADPEPAIRYGISAIPCVKVFKKGELIATNVGFEPYEGMKKFVEENV